MPHPSHGMSAVGQNADALGLSHTALPLLRDLIEERAGVFFDDRKLGMLADKVSELITVYDLTSFLDYYYLLRYDQDAPRHWNRLMDQLAVPETYLWRQHEQFLTLATVIAPAHFRRTRRPLRIWSAACCSGEEPLSIAIALAESGHLETGRVEIVGSDASCAMLERARRGMYRARSFRQLPTELRDRYFCQLDADTWRPQERLSSFISWHQANLVNPTEWSGLAEADAVFCRNVFIYFSDDAIRRVARALERHMPDDGYLFLGASESLTRFGTGFRLQELGKSFVYMKARANAPETA